MSKKDMEQNEINELIHKVIGACYTVHNTLGAGFLESVYENSLKIELAKQGVDVKTQCPIQVYYDGQVVGDFRADLLVENRLLVELKAIQTLAIAHEVQLVNYLVATGIDNGLLINFGESVEVKRKYRQYKAREKT